MTVWDILLLIVSCLLIIIIILQESKQDATSAFTGEKSELFANQKKRGIEVWISWITTGLAASFFVFAIIASFFVHRLS